MRKNWPFVFLMFALAVSWSCKTAAPAGTDSHYRVEEGDKDIVRIKQYFHDAVKARITGDYQRSAELFNKVLRLDPDHDAALYELGRLYFDTGQLNEALPLAEKAALLKPDNVWYQLLLGKVLMNLGRYEEASQTYSRVIDMDPANLDNYLMLAFIYEQAGHPSKAIKVLNQVEDEIGVNEQISIEKKRLYLKMDDLPRAIEEIQKLIDAFPDEPRYRVMLADLYLANGMEPEAMEVYSSLLETDPDNPEAHMALAEYYRSKNDSLQYKEHIEAAFRNPDYNLDQKVSYLFGNLSNQNPDPLFSSESFRLGKLLTEAHPNEAKAWAMYGDILYQADSTDAALAAYREAIHLNNSVFSVWQQLFFIYSDRQQFDSLLAVTNRALDLFPNQSAAYFFNGVALNFKKRYEEAIQSLEQVVMIGTPNPLMLSETWSNLGDAYYGLKNYPASDSCYEQSLKINPENAYVLNNWAYYLSLRGDQLDRAESMIREAVQLIPNNDAFEDTYGWILYQKGRYEEAEKWISKAMKHGGKSATILEHYGDVLFRLGQVDEAVNYWKKAYDKDPSNEDLGRKIEERQLDE